MGNLEYTQKMRNDLAQTERQQYANEMDLSESNIIEIDIKRIQCLPTRELRDKVHDYFTWRSQKQPNIVQIYVTRLEKDEYHRQCNMYRREIEWGKPMKTSPYDNDFGERGITAGPSDRYEKLLVAKSPIVEPEFTIPVKVQKEVIIDTNCIEL